MISELARKSCGFEDRYVRLQQKTQIDQFREYQVRCKEIWSRQKAELGGATWASAETPGV
jgi:hypothetical protein